jgi:hypothetical protein
VITAFREAGPPERVGRDLHLDVPDTLRGQVPGDAAHQVRDVFRLGHQPADRVVHVDEVREVAELVKSPELLGRPGHAAVRMPSREPQHGLHGRRTDQMNVKFHLGQLRNELLNRLHALDGNNPSPPRRFSLH